MATLVVRDCIAALDSWNGRGEAGPVEGLRCHNPRMEFRSLVFELAEMAAEDLGLTEDELDEELALLVRLRMEAKARHDFANGEAAWARKPR